MLLCNSKQIISAPDSGTNPVPRLLANYQPFFKSYDLENLRIFVTQNFFGAVASLYSSVTYIIEELLL